MSDGDTTHRLVREGRIAGALYLSLGLAGAFGIMYVPATLVVPGDPAVTAANVLARETLFRCGNAAELISAILLLFLALALHRLLGRVSASYARAMVLFVAVSVAVGFANALTNVAALAAFRGSDLLAAFDRSQAHALGAWFLDVHRQGIAINEIFWGLWLFPFGLLVMKSGFIPRIFGILLIVNGAAYLVVSLASLLAPAYADAVAQAMMLPVAAGELTIIPWLLIKGARVPPETVRVA